jgi:uncharacterized Zn finger protein
MGEHPRIDLVCGRCGNRKSAFRALNEKGMIRRKGNPAPGEVRPLLARMRCQACGSKGAVRMEIKEEKAAAVRYVATSESSDRVFHRDSCGWMRHVPRRNELRFRDRDHAVRAGFSPCQWCRP